MIKQLPCDIWDCKNHEMGFCKLEYPVMEPKKDGKKLYVVCGDFESISENLPFTDVDNDYGSHKECYPNYKEEE